MVTIREKDEAYALLADPDFQKQHMKLYESCTWATGFQSLGFLTAWYDCYRDDVEPLLILEAGPNDGVTGFLALAREKDGVRLTVAGSYQAEYHCWLTTDENSEAFLVAALKALWGRHAMPKLTFKYLPKDVPVDWRRVSGASGCRAHVRVHARPLIDLGKTDVIHGALRKKSNKSRMNRLKRLGHLRLQRLRSKQELVHVIDQIAEHYDLRQGAANAVCPFREDPVKRRFHLALMDVPDLLYTSALLVGDDLVAAHIGFQNRDTVSVGVYSHSPFLARHSPGKILMWLLAQELAEQGFKWLDLTPGGKWKERFATDYEDVYEITVFFAAVPALKEQIEEFLLSTAAKCLRWFGIAPSQARHILHKVSRLSLPLVAKHMRRLLWEDKEFRVYYMDAAIARRIKPDTTFARDSLREILAYQAAESWQSYHKFLAASLERIENGEHVYTRVEDDRLIHCGWLIERQEQSFFSEVEQGHSFPKNTAVLYDYYTDPQARGCGLYQRSIRQMLHDAANMDATERIAISVLSDNAPSRHVIEKLGFVYEMSLFLKRRFGFVRRWKGRGQSKHVPGS